MNGHSQHRIWIEVDDLIRYFDGSVTPTGIGRVQAQILPWLADAHRNRVAFCRVSGEGRVDVLDYEEVAQLIDGNDFLRRQKTSFWPLPVLKLRRYLGRRAASAAKTLRHSKTERQRFASTVRKGDILLNLGASWTHTDFGKSIAHLKATHGIRFALLVHDVLPVSHPNLVAPGHIPTFTAWLHNMARVWDLVLTPSRSSADALRTYLDACALPVPETQAIPFGAGFASAPSPAEVPIEDRSHILYVSTIEIRKNHMLLFRVWERLIREHGADAVPELVFAGKYGWEIDELRQAFLASHSLGGKIKVVENLSDDELAALYRTSLFTLFPSFCEGWGLPVSESLYHGRYCIASDATSLPEVGGGFIDYHAPDDAERAYQLIERAIFDRTVLAEKERTIKKEYPCPTWEFTAHSIVAALDRHFSSSCPPSRPLA